MWLTSYIVVNPPTKQLNRESTWAHQTSAKKEFVKSLNGALRAFVFYGRNYIIEADKLTGFEQFVRNRRSIYNLFFFLFKGVWVNSRSHKLLLLLRQGVTWFAPRKSDVEIKLTIETLWFFLFFLTDVKVQI